MKDYINYSPEELAQDPYFVKWVTKPDLRTESFWNNWLDTFPFKSEDVQQARQLILYVGQINPISDTDAQEVKKAIFDTIRSNNRKGTWRYWFTAAATLLLIGSSYYFFLNKNLPTTTYETHVKQVGSDLVELQNNSETPLLVNLPDRSSVIIQKGGKITYPKTFGENIREVVFTGNGFFEITPNKNKPFIVRANQLTAKVLGTSFFINTDDQTAEAKLTVKTGKVAVYLSANPETNKNLQQPDLEGIVITPGEEASYSERKLNNTIHDKITVLPAIKNDYVPIQIFEDTKIKEVFALLEKYYPIEIVYDMEKLGNCSLTATLSDEPLLTKLELICKATQSSYTIDKNKIYVRSNGC